MPGRKSDISAAEWLAELVAHGLVRPSFVPLEDIRQLRDLSQSPTVLVAERTRKTQRFENELEHFSMKFRSCIKLSVVVPTPRRLRRPTRCGKH